MFERDVSLRYLDVTTQNVPRGITESKFNVVVCSEDEKIPDTVYASAFTMPDPVNQKAIFSPNDASHVSQPQSRTHVWKRVLNTRPRAHAPRAPLPRLHDIVTAEHGNGKGGLNLGISKSSKSRNFKNPRNLGISKSAKSINFKIRGKSRLQRACEKLAWRHMDLMTLRTGSTLVIHRKIVERVKPT